MSKVITAEYDAERNALQLVEPLEGVADREKVDVTIVKAPTSPGRWQELSGILSKEDGEELSRAMEEMFPPWNE